MPLGHMIDFNDYTVDDWDGLIKLASDIHLNQRDYIHRCEGRIMATLFYEPSTRTQMSFQAAMLRLGGQIIGFDNPVNSSVSKGETLHDTIKIVSGYADLIVMRHPMEGAAKAASLYSQCPIVNAGDGGHLHPTQTLTDIFTLSNTKQRLTGLNIGVCGDLKYGRTVHSLIKAMCRFEGNKFFLIATPELSVPEYIEEVLIASRCEYCKVSSIEECIGELDVLYMTRIQRERFASSEEYDRQSGVFILDTQKLKKAKDDLAILHPLPRVDEIEFAIDGDSRALYFRQAELGMFARMALILKIIGNDLPELKAHKPELLDNLCVNPRCITHAEKYLPHYYKNDDSGKKVCLYCDEKLS
jgi:aspartate carbamoyltransferase catalytic subunit